MCIQAAARPPTAAGSATSTATAAASPDAMYAATFIFAKGEWDDEFHRLDQSIAAVARGLPGYLGEESWDNAAQGLISNVYYWDSLPALQALMDHPLHREAKRQQARWLRGYQVVVSQVLRMHGDGGLADRLPVTAMPPAA